MIFLLARTNFYQSRLGLRDSGFWLRLFNLAKNALCCNTFVLKKSILLQNLSVKFIMLPHFLVVNAMFFIGNRFKKSICLFLNPIVLFIYVSYTNKICLYQMFQNASSLKPLGQLKPNCPGIIIGRSSTKLGFLCRSEIQDGHHRRTQINIGPYGKMFKCLLLRNYKSELIQTRLGWSSTKFWFFVPI